jgi:serine/threonine protein kinase
MTERFTLLTELGRGGMGVVWKARDEETGQIVAFKLLREMYAEDPDYLARFERELELARRIDSAHVVKVLGFGVRKKVPYLALEFIDGPSLHDALVKHGPYGWPEARALMVQIAQGLADAHAAGVIHRDVKPSNVLIGPDGVAKLTDFGIARGLDLERMTATSTMLGTPAYLAPEGPKDARSDLYSLGIIGYQLLVGSPPFVGQTYQEVLLAHLRDAPDLTRLPSEVRPIIGWLLAKDPAQRPRNAWEAMPVVEGRLFLTNPIADSSESGPLASAVSGTRRPAERPPAPLRAPERRSNIRTSNADDRGSEGPWELVSTEIKGPRSIDPRAWHTAVVLSDGRVLFAGGQSAEVALSSAQLYQPHTDTVARAGYMKHARLDHAAVPLIDGRVLICGGVDDSVTASAELYDAKSGKFLETGSMADPRQLQTATLMPNGQVLVAGGLDGQQTLASIELYEPTSGRFFLVGSMSEPREGHTSTPLQGGRILLVGGANGGYLSDTGEIYDPATASFQSVGPMMAGRSGHTATLLSNGMVLIAGGRSLESAECFNPRSGLLSVVSPMRVAREGHTATLLGKGLVLVVGGSNGTGALSSAECYYPSTEKFTDAGRLQTARVDHSATLLPDGRVLIAGGLDKDGRPLDSIELLTLEHAL